MFLEGGGWEVSMEIGVVGSQEELGDVSVALSGGLEQRSCV